MKFRGMDEVASSSYMKRLLDLNFLAMKITKQILQYYL